ncbi:MAG: ACT domain-containing protein [Halobacteriota archaeon]
MTDDKMLKQISLFAEHKPGRLTDATRILSENGINIQAFTIADAGEFGIIRFVVDDADASLKHLRRAGFTVSETQVIGIDMTDEPGALYAISRTLSDNNINVEHAYAFKSSVPHKAILVMQASDLTQAARLLSERGFHLIASSP